MKPKTLWMILPLLFQFYGSSWGQIDAPSLMEGKKGNRINFLWGYHLTKSQDLIFSPMTYEGNTGSALGLEYERDGQRGLHQFRLAFDKTQVSGTPLINWEAFDGTRTRKPGEALQINISYGYMHALSTSENFTFYMGGLLEAKIHHTTYHFGISEEEGYVLANSLNSWMRADYRINQKNTLQASLFLPLVSWISRPDYAIVNNEEILHEGSDLAFVYQKGALASWGAYRAINFSLVYERAISAAVSLQLRYQVDYLRYEEPLVINVLKNNFDVGIGVDF